MQQGFTWYVVWLLLMIIGYMLKFRLDFSSKQLCLKGNTLNIKLSLNIDNVLPVDDMESRTYSHI